MTHQMDPLSNGKVPHLSSSNISLQDEVPSLSDVKLRAMHNPTIAYRIQQQAEEPQHQSLVRKVLWISGRDLFGYVADRVTRKRADTVASTGLIAQSVNFLTTLPFTVVAMGNVFTGAALALSVYAFSNVSQKQAVIKPYRKNPWANTAAVSYAVINLAASCPGPLGILLLRFQPDIRMRIAQDVVATHVLAPQQAAIKDAEDKMSYAEAIGFQCADLMQQYEMRKAMGDETYHHYFRAAYGPYIHDVSPQRWQGVPTDSLPACPKSERLATEAQQEIETAHTALRDQEAEIKSEYGDNSQVFLKEEKPELYDAYFYPSGRIRSGREELNQAVDLFSSGEGGVKVTMLAPGFLSFVTSIISILLTYHYANLPTVKLSWKSSTGLKHHQRMKEMEAHYRNSYDNQGGAS